MYIVQGEEAQPEYLVGDEEVPDIGAAESYAGGAIAFRIERLRIGAELGALYVEPAIAGEDGAVPTHARGCHAVEQIDAAPDRLDQVFGEPDAHQVARMSLWQRVIHDLDDLVHGVFFLTDGKAADPESRPVVHLANHLRCFAPEVRVDPALHDGKECLVRALAPLQLGETPRQPADAALARVSRRSFVRLSGDDVVELHDHVGSEVAL